MINDLNNYFHPQSIAVIGASREPNKVGRVILDNLIKGFKGKIFPVNPKAAEIANLTCYPSILSIKEKIDLVIICIPSVLINQEIIKAADIGIKNFLIISAGFAESGVIGIALEKELKDIIKTKELRVLGPNTLGFINNDDNLNATFSSFSPQKGPVSFIVQSGALMTTFLDWADEREVGISKVICLGNKAGINENTALDYLAADANTKVIAVYLESISNGSELINKGLKLVGKKPLIIFKSGKSYVSKNRITSHTGKMAGSYESALAAFEKIKAVISNNLEEFFHLVYLMSDGFIVKDKNIIVITNAGAPGIIATDEAIDNGWNLIPLTENSLNKLKLVLPPNASLKNPIDIIGDANPLRLKAALEIINEEPINNILIIISPQTMTDIPNTAKVIAEFTTKTSKNIFTCFLGGKKAFEAKKFIESAKCTNFPFTHQAFETLNKAYNFYHNWFASPSANALSAFSETDKNLSQILANAKLNSKKVLDQEEVGKFCQAYNIPLPKQAVVTDIENAIAKSLEFGFPVVLKTNNIHKTDLKEIYLDLDSAQKLTPAFNYLKNKSPNLLLQKQIKTDNIELILGSTQDPDFGIILSFGLGGIYTEILKKFKTMIPPLSFDDVKYLVENLEFYYFLSPKFREKIRPTQKLIQLITNFSQLISKFPLIQSMEINPILFTDTEIFCVDVRILVDTENEKS